MTTVDVDGVPFAIDTAGSGDPPFVFIHGFACDRTMWRPQFEDLSRDHRCISVDLRGRGETPAVPPYNTTRQADDIAAIMSVLGVGPAIIVGHSLGGIVALLLNERHPELVLGTVIGDSPVRKGGLGGARLAAALHEATTAEPIRPLLASFWSADTPDDIKAAITELMLSCPADVAAGMLEAAPDGRIADLVRLADRKPFMALWAEKPLGDPAWLREVTLFLRQEPIAGAGHFFQLENAPVTNALLRAFLDDVERDPRHQR
jgi:pimeloyl-ACP methyl ester carboxylesterase